MQQATSGNRVIRDTLQASGDPRVARTRSAILHAVRVLSESGRELSVTSISSTAGVSRATFYSHYADLDELANSVRRDAFTFISEIYLVDRHGDSDALRLSQERLVAHFAKHRPLYLAVAALPLSRQNYLDSVRAMARAIAKALTEHPGLPAGLQVEATARYIAGAAYGLLDAWVATEIELAESELVDHLMRLLPPWFSDIR